MASWLIIALGGVVVLGGVFFLIYWLVGSSKDE